MNNRTINSKLMMKDPVGDSLVLSHYVNQTEVRLSKVEESVYSIQDYLLKGAFKDDLVKSIKESLMNELVKHQTDAEDSSFGGSSEMTPEQIIDNEWQNTPLSASLTNKLNSLEHFETIVKREAPFLIVFRLS